MYTQTNKAGIKHFLLTLISVAVVGIILSYVKFIMPNKLAADVIIIAVFFLMGYPVFLKYCAVFEYSTDGETLTLLKKTGHRTTRISVDIKKIKKFTNDKRAAALPKQVTDMCVCIISKKRVYYAVYYEDKVKKAVKFEPSEEFIRKMRKKG